MGLPCTTAICTLPPISTDGVPTMAAAGISPHFSEPEGTTIAMGAADAFFAGAFVCAKPVADTTRHARTKTLRRIVILRQRRLEATKQYGLAGELKSGSRGKSSPRAGTVLVSNGLELRFRVHFDFMFRRSDLPGWTNRTAWVGPSQKQLLRSQLQPGFRCGRDAIAVARPREERADAVQRDALGFPGHADSREIQMRRAVDHAEPVASGGKVIEGSGAPLPAAFEALVFRAGQNIERLADFVPGMLGKNRAGPRSGDRHVSVEAIFSAHAKFVRGAGFKHHRLRTHRVPEQRAKRAVALLVRPLQGRSDIHQPVAIQRGIGHHLQHAVVHSRSPDRAHHRLRPALLVPHDNREPSAVAQALAEIRISIFRSAKAGRKNRQRRARRRSRNAGRTIDTQHGLRSIGTSDRDGFLRDAARGMKRYEEKTEGGKP